MTVQQQMTSAEQFEQLWTALMPGFETPDQQQFLLWVGTYPDELVSRGINRAGCKAVRYAASVMKNELLGHSQTRRPALNGTRFRFSC